MSITMTADTVVRETPQLPFFTVIGPVPTPVGQPLAKPLGQAKGARSPQPHRLWKLRPASTRFDPAITASSLAPGLVSGCELSAKRVASPGHPTGPGHVTSGHARCGRSPHRTAWLGWCDTCVTHVPSLIIDYIDSWSERSEPHPAIPCLPGRVCCSVCLCRHCWAFPQIHSNSIKCLAWRMGAVSHHCPAAWNLNHWTSGSKLLQSTAAIGGLLLRCRAF